MNQKLKLLSTKKQIQEFFGETPLIAGSIRLTNACNLRCPHCYTNGGTCLPNELKLPEIKKVLDEMAKLKTMYMFYTGGEPFIRSDIIEILKYTDSKKIGISLSTNGQLVQNKQLKQLRNIPFRLFQVSLDGPKEVHNAIRGQGVWEKSVQTIKAAKKILKKNVVVGTVIMKKNWQDLDKVLDQAIKLKADYFALMLLIVSGRADESLSPAPEEHMKCIRKVFNRYKKYSSKIQFAKNATILPALIPKEWRQKGLPETFAPCSFPYCIAVSANGDVAPCDGFFNCPDMIVGNIREKPLAEIWRNSKKLKEVRKIDPADLKGVCQKCVYRDYCVGGCRAYAYIKYKDLTAPDPVCQSIYEKGLFPKDCLK